MSRFELNLRILPVVAWVLLAASGCPEKYDTTTDPETSDAIRQTVERPSIAPAVRYQGIKR